MTSIHRKQKHLQDDVTAAFKKAAAVIRKADENGRMEWAKYKDTKVLNIWHELMLSAGFICPLAAAQTPSMRQITTWPKLANDCFT